MTGMSAPRKRCSARSIVPSPPRTTATSAPERSCSGSPTPCFSTSSSGRSSSTPASLATFSSRLSAGPIVGGFPCVITAARRTGLFDCRGDAVVEVVGEERVLTLDEVEEPFPVALWARQTRVYDRNGLRPPAGGSFGDFADDAAADVAVADDAALADFGA